MVSAEAEPPQHAFPGGGAVAVDEAVGARAARDQHLALPPERLAQELGRLRVRGEQHVPLPVTVVHLAVDEVLDHPLAPPEPDPDGLERVAREGPEQPLARSPGDPGAEVLVVAGEPRAGQGVVPLPAAAQHRLGALRDRDGAVSHPPDTTYVGPVLGQPAVDGELVAGRVAAAGAAQQDALGDRHGCLAVALHLPAAVHLADLVVAQRRRQHEHCPAVGPLAHLDVHRRAVQPVRRRAGVRTAERHRAAPHDQRIGPAGCGQAVDDQLDLEAGASAGSARRPAPAAPSRPWTARPPKPLRPPSRRGSSPPAPPRGCRRESRLQPRSTRRG